MRIPYGTIAVIQVDQLDCTELQMQVHQPDQELASFAIVTGAIKVGDFNSGPFFLAHIRFSYPVYTLNLLLYNAAVVHMSWLVTKFHIVQSLQQWPHTQHGRVASQLGKPELFRIA